MMPSYSQEPDIGPETSQRRASNYRVRHSVHYSPISIRSIDIKVVVHTHTQSHLEPRQTG
jgi:hypothetical protein